MYAVTGASGQLGRLVIDALLRTVAPSEVVALVRNPSKLADLAARGVVVRAFDYDAPATLVPALAGVDRLLLISSSEVGSREAQHGAVIAAARTAGVGYIAYTSILHADANPMNLAIEHRATEAAIAASGLPHAFLRNGWYTENYVMSVAPAIEHGALIGSAGDGRVSSASREDYADAAAAVLVDGSVETRIFELAGDDAYTLTDFAAAIGDIAGRPVIYKDLPQDDYRGVLEGAGLPAPIADMLAESDAKAAQGSLFDDGRALSTLIGRPTTPWRTTLAAAMKGQD
ncbi:NAD(P)H dehydrogenase (quinone) [Sphingomonas sp. PP-CE-3G-477]|uniref:SDR family oxidoreductase n=1 Tax=Sphingomonas sp. PP-CE-3G-477 TaxID=2135660 RepID=UPI000D378CA1|nr:SDR family oxidoreductase [Sphingomonas sp. PP-CE-3G-477]PTQ65443.1 NAD(P)H dehydrogenase (quinone) [Sphingomonas sp. PP-CE-3G-477]